MKKRPGLAHFKKEVKGLKGDADVIGNLAPFGMDKNNFCITKRYSLAS